MNTSTEKEQTEQKKIVVVIPPGTDFNDEPPLPAPEPSPNLMLVLESQKKLRQLVASDIVFSLPMMEQAGNAMLYPNTINVVQGQAGKHKSRLAEHICAALLKTDDCTNELLGFKRTEQGNNHTVVYVDTERNLMDQLPAALQSIQTKAGYAKEDTLQHFQYISLLRVRRKQRFDTLKEYLEHLRRSDTHSLFIVLDVSTDCIEDFNKVDGSLELVDLMNMAINETDVTFMCIIHENPGTEKSRGHFGTELMNKATTQIQVSFEKDANQQETELIRARYLKCRGTRGLKPFYFKFCDNTKGLVLASDAEIKTAMDSKKFKAGMDSVIEQIELYLGDGSTMSRTELFDRLCIDFATSLKTMHDRVKEIVDTNATMVNNEGRNCTLYKEKIEKEVLYSLRVTEN